MGGAALAMLAASTSWAGPPEAGVGLLLSWAAAGQLPSLSSGPQREGEDLLKRSREALVANNFELAEYYVGLAEKTGANLTPFLNPLADTPDKIRRDIAAGRKAGPAQPAGQPQQPPPGQRFAPAMAPGDRPAAAVNAKPDPFLAGDPSRLVGLTANGNKAKCDHFLKEARAALARNDVATATGYYQQAVAQKAQYPANEYGPQQLAAELNARGVDISQLPDPTKLPPAFASRESDMQPGFDRLPPTGGNRTADAFAGQVVSNPNNVGPQPSYPGVRGPNAPMNAVPMKGAPVPPGSVTVGVTSDPNGVSQPSPWAQARKETQRHLAAAQAALDRGEVQLAERLVQEAKKLGVPENEYQQGDMHPWHLEIKVAQALRQPRDAAVRPVSGFAEVEPSKPGTYPVARAAYDPNNDFTRNLPASVEEAIPAKLPPTGEDDPLVPGAIPVPGPALVPGGNPNLNPVPGGPAAPGQIDPRGALPGAPMANGQAASESQANANEGRRLFDEGRNALAKTRDKEAAYRSFLQAWAYERYLDEPTRQQLKTYLTQLRTVTPRPLAPGESPTLNEEAQRLQALLRGMQAEIAHEQEAATNQAVKDPRGALARLEQLRQRVAQSEVNAEARKAFLVRVDRHIESLKGYIEANRSSIEETETNATVRGEVDRKRRVKEETGIQLAKMVEQFNTLMDQRRFGEAVVLAKQAEELDPENPVTKNLTWQARFGQRLAHQMSLNEEKEQAVYDVLTGVDKSGIPFDDNNPIRFDEKGWAELTKRRGGRGREGRRLSAAEKQIQRALTMEVECNFVNKPLGVVMHTFSQVAGINIHLDPQGLAAEGQSPDTAVTFNLPNPITLKSALRLILEPLKLSYVIKNDVLRVTSDQVKDSDVYTEVYNVADLVIPIPNFVPSYNIGLPGAIRAAHEQLGYGLTAGRVYESPMAIAATGNGNAGGGVLAQMAASGVNSPLLPRNTSASRGSMPVGYGPGGLGGGPRPDFDSLIDLITSTISPTTWDDVGGPGSVAGFDTNLSLVVSQTQEVHDQIVDLLEQLRRLQDLQVTIEVRFITISDQFFERIGVNFNFNLDSNVSAVQAAQASENSGPSVTVGLTNAPGGTSLTTASNLELQFTQGSFASAIPQFGGFDANTAANFGFAVLSDIEAFFFIQAAQGDTRSNIMQSPKVTLFNGQQAFVSDTTQVPFVTSVIPVVGDFAVGHQPVVVVLNEGTSLSVQAVVANDKRFVRLTMVPFFSKIGDVKEFTFQGTTTSNTGSVAVDPADPKKNVVNNQQETHEGTTIQLPNFSFTTVNTTVSVPDGGTVLLGGIKRLSEGRTERGVPILSKVPYINRLFKNVGIGRQASSLMMMVTPRIIIQEEEEEKLGIAGFGNS